MGGEESDEELFAPGVTSAWGRSAAYAQQQEFSQQAAAAGSTSHGSFGGFPNQQPPGPVTSWNGQAEAASAVSGKVKSYNRITGYGFIKSSTIADDIYFAKDSLTLDLQNLDLTGQNVNFDIAYAKNGKPQARNLKLDGWVSFSAGISGAAPPRPGQSNSSRWDVQSDGQNASSRVQRDGGGGERSGTVKSYNTFNGYGFIRCSDVPEDIWFCRDNLNEELRAADVTGQRMLFELAYAKTGKPQARNMRIDPKPAYLFATPPTIVMTAPAPPEPVANRRLPKAGTVLSGQIARYSPLQGFGFIKHPEVPQDIWFINGSLAPELKGQDPIGTLVTFDICYARDGKPQAQSIRPINVAAARQRESRSNSSTSSGGSSREVKTKARTKSVSKRKKKRRKKSRSSSSSSSSGSSSHSSRRKHKQSSNPQTVDPGAAGTPAAVESEEVKEAKSKALNQLLKLQTLEPREARSKEFRLLLRSWHPDKNQDNVEVATAVFQFLQKGKALLKLGEK